MPPDDSKNAPAPGSAARASYAELEARLGHTFRNAALCETAMTHTSWLNEAGQPDRSDNERLEFLGDAVLDLVVSDILMRRFPDRRGGDLSRARAALVSESGLAQVALRHRSRAVHPARQGRGADAAVARVLRSSRTRWRR